MKQTARAVCRNSVRRGAIARAMAMEPRGLLCDEITSALDPELKNEVLDAPQHPRTR